jgi:hypothetical protein
LLLPSSGLVLAPIGRLDAGGFHVAPGSTRRLDRVGIIAVEDEHDPRIALRILRHGRALDEEADRGAVRIGGTRRQEHGLGRRVAILIRRVRKKARLIEAPKPLVERRQALARRPLNHDAPSLLEALLDELRQHRLERARLQVIKEDFRHPAHVAETIRARESGDSGRAPANRRKPRLPIEPR